MTPDRFGPDETEITVEQLLIKKNGRTKTANDVFEVVVAMHHDAKKRDAMIASKMDDHLTGIVHFTPIEFEKFIGRFEEKGDKRDAIIAALDDDMKRIETDVLLIQENCKALHERAPRRSTDPENFVWDEEHWEIKKAWRFLKYVVYAICGGALVVIGDHISHTIWPNS